jgi:hypothetical protein
MHGCHLLLQLQGRHSSCCCCWYDKPILAAPGAATAAVAAAAAGGEVCLHAIRHVQHHVHCTHVHLAQPGCSSSSSTAAQVSDQHSAAVLTAQVLTVYSKHSKPVATSALGAAAKLPSHASV